MADLSDEFIDSLDVRGLYHVRARLVRVVPVQSRRFRPQGKPRGHQRGGRTARRLRD